MPITRSAKKALRKNKKQRVRNMRNIRTMKQAVKQVRRFVAQGKQEDAKKLLPTLYKVLDKSTKKNILKKNTAARYKSRITKAVNKTQTT